MNHRLILRLLCAALALCCLLPCLAAGEDYPPRYEAETCIEFHLRMSPDSSYHGRKVPAFAKVTVYDAQGGWYWISYKNEMGWAKAEWLWAFRSLDAGAYPVPGFSPCAGVITLQAAQQIEAAGFKGMTAEEGTLLAATPGENGEYTLPVWRGETYLPRDAGAFTPFVPWQEAQPGDLIGGFTTYYHPRQGAPLHAERQYNIALGCDFISGTVCPPGAAFSFNALCGPYKKSAGYQVAKNISKDGTGPGGGICQVTTTLFDAVLGLPLQITVWSPHRYTGVDYVPVSLDAAVGNSRDFQFVNSLPYPIRLWADPQGGAVTVLIYRAEE